MKLIRKYKKTISVLLGLNYLFSLLMPNQAFAITGHSSMPEYRSFEPVATTNMVNMFDGSLNYNIPLMDVPNGYPINLSYHSNEVNTEAQASWVGLGWTLNPGAINRVKRGFPDDYDGNEVTYHSKMPKNWTVAAGIGGDLEFLGEETKEGLFGASVGVNVHYNNYNGVGSSLTGGLNALGGVASLHFNYERGKLGFSPSLSPGALIARYLTPKPSQSRIESREAAQKSNTQSQKGNENKSEATKVEKSKKRSYHSSKPSIGMSIGGVSGGYTGGGNTSFAVSASRPRSFPVAVTGYRGSSLRLQVEAGANFLPLASDIEGSLWASYSEQKYDDVVNRNVYGYMNLEGAIAHPEAMMDYFTEKEKMFEKRDRVLGIPFPNNDLFSVSGEALGGTFRPHRNEFGHYRKNEVASETISADVGLDVNLPIPVSPPVNAVFTTGASVSGDYHSLKVGSWTDPGNIDQFRGKADFVNSDEKFYLKFSGDMATVLDYEADLNTFEEPVRATLDKNGLEATLNLNTLETTGGIPSTFALQAENDQRVNRSSYIGSSLKSDFSEKSQNIAYKVEEKNLSYLDGGTVEQYDRLTYAGDPMEEVYTYNKDGVRYVYGLPILTQNEKQLSYSVKSSEVTLTDGLIASINNNVDLDTDAKFKKGYSAEDPYASQFLLTQITSPDYIDKTYNGPSPDDFGSYTRINYNRIAGGGDWYTYRSPFENAHYDYGTLSSNKDDMVSMTSGEKELYYIHSIVSKTHVAIFTTSGRTDGVESNNGSITSKGKGSKKLQKLDKIELYALSDVEKMNTAGSFDHEFYQPIDGAKPIKTVHFEYEDASGNEYTLCNGLPNNVNSSNTNSGKLTLKRVWFEYQGIVKNQISPYVFHYEYPTAATPAINYPTVYAGLEMSATLNQNPDYNVLNSDAWGNYRDFSAHKDPSKFGNLARFFPHVDQDPDPDFDPAAHILKRIELPSGGEIHIQYEQNDYEYVQDKKAMMMVPLSAQTLSGDEGETSKKYYLDLDKVGITLTGSNADKLAVLRELFAPMMNNRIYFKFLYSLVGDVAPNYTTINSEYIEGYSKINGFGFDGNGAYFKFKGNSGTEGVDFLKTNYGNDQSKFELPQKVCKEFYKSQRRGMISGASNSMSDDDGAEDKARALLSIISQVAGVAENCQQIEPTMSFVRLQTLGAKKGGGVRVKRLLMYDNGITNSGSDDVLYGSEYSYGYTEGGVVHSYGVATNEPSPNRYESPLVNPIERDQQSKGSAILYGRDMYGQDGPIGESLLPGPSVGYSQIKVSNIHQGITSTGYEIHEFYTCKDFPFIAMKTDINSIFTKPISGSAGAFGISGSYNRNNPYMTQGYTIIKNEMHGKPKRVAKFSHGDTSGIPLAEQTYEYYGLGEAVDVVDLSETEAGDYAVRKKLRLGVESEVLAEIRQVKDMTYGGSVGSDGTTGAYVPTPPGLVPIPVIGYTVNSLSGFVNEQILRTHVINKIINYPAMVKKTTNRADGVLHITENLAFDINTGDAVVTKSYDDFDQGLINQDYMASWMYPNMGSKAQNEKTITTGMEYNVHPTTGRTYLQFLGGSNQVNGGCGAAGSFIEGDFVQVKLDGNSSVLLYHINEVDVARDRLYIEESALSETSNITNYPVTVNSLEVLSSGYTNQMTAKVGNVNRKYLGNGENLYRAASSVPVKVQNQFTEDLQAAFIAWNGSSSNLPILTGPYSGSSVPLDLCYSSVSTCSSTGDAGVQIQNVQIGIAKSGTSFEFSVTSFDVFDEDAGIFETVTCNGANGGTFDPYFAKSASSGGSSSSDATLVENNSNSSNKLAVTTNNGGGDTPMITSTLCSFPGNTMSLLDRNHDGVPTHTKSITSPDPCKSNNWNPNSCWNTGYATGSYPRIVAGSDMTSTIEEYYGGAVLSNNTYSTASRNPEYLYRVREATTELNECVPIYNECLVARVYGPSIDQTKCYLFKVDGPGGTAQTGFQTHNWENEIHHVFVDASPYVSYGGQNFREIQLDVNYTVNIYENSKTALGNCSQSIPATPIITYDVIFRAAKIEDNMEIVSSNLSGSSSLQYKVTSSDYWDVNMNFEMDLSSTSGPQYPIYSIPNTLAKTEFECVEVTDWNDNKIYSSGVDFEWRKADMAWAFTHDFNFRMNKAGKYRVRFHAISHQGVRKTFTKDFHFKSAMACPVTIDPLMACFEETNGGLDLKTNSSIDFSLTSTFCVPEGGEYACNLTVNTQSLPAQTFSNCGPWSVNINSSDVNKLSSFTYGTVNNYSGAVYSDTRNVLIKDCREPKLNYLEGSSSCPSKTLELEVHPLIGSPAIEILAYEWDLDDGNGWVYLGPGTVQDINYSNTDCSAKTIRVRAYNNNSFDGTKQYSNVVEYEYVGNGNLLCHPICGCSSEIVINNYGTGAWNATSFVEEVGEFAIDANTGEIGFTNVGCPRFYTFDCIKFCTSSITVPQPSAITESNVLAASATTYGDEWPYDESLYQGNFITGANSYEKGTKGKWRPVSQHTYRDNLIAGNKNSNQGYFTMDLFDWATENNNAEKWVKTSTTTQYSPNGDPIEDKNILNIYSAAKYGYNNTLPIAVAQNSLEKGIAYESFENQYSSGQYWEDGILVDSDGDWISNKSHTGDYSINLQENKWFDVGEATFPSEGGIVRVWVHQEKFETSSSGKTILTDYSPIVLQLDDKNFPTHPIPQVNFVKIASAGEWSLYEAKVYSGDFEFRIKYAGSSDDGGGGTPDADKTSSVVNKAADIPNIPTTITENVYIDDVRIQPYSSEMVCYVYDKQQKLIAVFDDQHFAQIYQYNAEGELVRKLKETTEGIKTISETQYNTVKVER